MFDSAAINGVLESLEISAAILSCCLHVPTQPHRISKDGIRHDVLLGMGQYRIFNVDRISIDTILATITFHVAAAVGSQRCGATGVLGEEIGPHNATTPWTSLAEDHRSHPVPFVCPGLPLFTR